MHFCPDEAEREAAAIIAHAWQQRRHRFAPLPDWLQEAQITLSPTSPQEPLPPCGQPKTPTDERQKPGPEHAPAASPVSIITLYPAASAPGKGLLQREDSSLDAPLHAV